MKRQRLMQDFFASKSARLTNTSDSEGEANTLQQSSTGSSQPQDVIIDTPSITTAATATSAATTGESLPSTSVTNDIGNVASSRVSLTSLSSQDKLELLKKRWKPDDTTGWPYSERKDGNKIRKKYLGPQHTVYPENTLVFHTLRLKRVCSVFLVFSSEQRLLGEFH